MAKELEAGPTEAPELSKSNQNAVNLAADPPHQTNGTSSEWSPSSWTTKPIQQDVVYSDRSAVSKALAKLERLPPLVTPTEIVKLRNSLRDVALGKGFLLQGGDCAELFDYCEERAIESKIKLLLQMSLVLIWGANKPVLRIARMAGQFAKPRSKPTEMHEGKEILAFRGDNINGYSPSDRTPDPKRLVEAYFHSASTLNFMRASLSSGIADLHSPLEWELGHVRDEEIKAKYQAIVSSITESLRFMRTVGVDTNASGLETVDLYTSHEALLLEYEQSLTRLLRHPPQANSTPPPLPASTLPVNLSRPAARSPTPANQKGHYNTSAHFLWIGDRTRDLTGAHIEYIRGIENPIGLKVGPTLSPIDLVALLDTLNPTRAVGKITLITRYGEHRITALLPAHIRAVQASGHVPVWACDPMHGNTRTSAPSEEGEGRKTRSFSSILHELGLALSIHREMGQSLGGVHLELTGEAVTECVGGSEELRDEDLHANYVTQCDPRLNERQALDLAFLVAGDFRGDHRVGAFFSDLIPSEALDHPIPLPPFPGVNH